MYLSMIFFFLLCVGCFVHAILAFVSFVSRPMTPEVSPPVEDQVTAAQRAKQEAHNDRIVATFNSVSVFLFRVFVFYKLD